MIYLVNQSNSWMESSTFYHSYSGGFFAFAFLVFSVLVYFLPSIVAIKRKHRNAIPILIMNIFLGWTFFGWVLALVWAFTDNIKNHD